MNALFMAHSGLRYLVLLEGVMNIAICVMGLATKRAYDKPARIIGASFLGMLHLQVLLGLVLVMVRPWYPALTGHLVCMLSAAVVSQVLSSRNRRLPTPGYVLPLIGTVAALALIVAGIFAIGRTPLGMTAMP